MSYIGSGTYRIEGFEEVMRNLNIKIAEMKNNSMKGLIEAAIIIRRDMDKTEPLIPVDLGNMRASWTTINVSVFNKKALLIGFSANYTFFVHEMLGMKPQPGWRYGPGKGKKRWYTPRPGAGPKFFEYALKRNTDVILETIRLNVKV
jgi:hypothetical protein